MLRVYTNIIFNQVPNDTYKNRNNKLTFNFVHDFEASSSWANLTNKAKITLPKNIFARDKNNTLVPLGGTNINLGGFDSGIPLFLRGDSVQIDAGYRYMDVNKKEVLTTSTLFTGFISAVSSKKPVVIECEDNMWKLKQIIAPNKVFPAKQYTLEKILQELIKPTQFTVNTLTDTSFGDFRTQNETVAEVLARIKKDFHFESYFRGSELRCGALVYIEQDAIDDGKKVFRFQKGLAYLKDGTLAGSIISDDLEYRRKDDIFLSAVAYSVNKFELGGLTKRGKRRTRSQRLEVLVTNHNGGFVVTQRPPGTKADFAPNTAGERRTLYFWDVPDFKALGDLAIKELQKYYYTGFKGKFTTFGMPFVRMGDNIDLLDNVLPERNGRYKVKSVNYTGGVGGLRQIIELDFLIARLDANGTVI